MGRAPPGERISMWFFPGVSGTGDFVMLDDVYDYTMVYITRGARRGFSRLGGLAGQRVTGPVYEFGISVSGKWALG